MIWKNRIKKYPFLWRLAKGSPSPVGWVGFGRITSLIAKTRSPKSPPVLILSLPRSGSSWVGEILGRAPNALYLREPITQSSMQQHGANRPILCVDKAQTDPALQMHAYNAFYGIPDFTQGIVHDAQQWNLRTRTQKRVVIKEVNPLAAEWIISEFMPQVILLVRHPVAVALSYKRLGWLDAPLSDVRSCLNQINKDDLSELTQPSNTKDFWFNNGLMQGGCLSYALALLDNYPNAKVIKHEELCEDPIVNFRDLFCSAGLEWSLRSENLIREKASGDDQRGPYSTNRDTKTMPKAWRTQVTQDEINQLRAAFSQFDLPWYTSDDEWSAGFFSSSPGNG